MQHFQTDQVTMRKAATLSGMDVGLRSYMQKVYNYMAVALGFTGVISFAMGQNPELVMKINGSGLGILLLIGMVAMPLLIGFRIHKMSFQNARLLFWTYSGIVGLALAPIFLAYTNESIARTFFITSATFLGMSLYGYTTKRDLTAMGSFLMMGFWGLFIAIIVNAFLQSSALHFVISAVGVVIFTGLTAYNTQRIKEVYVSSDTGEVASKKALYGALILYLDFINLFIMMLRFFGDRR